MAAEVTPRFSGCEVELFYCSEPGQLSLRKTGQTYLYVILAVKVDPDNPKVVAVASGPTCGNGVDGEKLPARDIHSPLTCQVLPQCLNQLFSRSSCGDVRHR